jgi:hypothetical protein
LRSVLAFLAITGFFVTINLVAAGVMFALGKLAHAIPGAAENPWTWLAVGLAGVGCAIGFAMAAINGKWLARVLARVPG